MSRFSLLSSSLIISSFPLPILIPYYPSCCYIFFTSPSPSPFSPSFSCLVLSQFLIISISLLLSFPLFPLFPLYPLLFFPLLSSPLLSSLSYLTYPLFPTSPILPFLHFLPASRTHILPHPDSPPQSFPISISHTLSSHTFPECPCAVPHCDYAHH